MLVRKPPSAVPASDLWELMNHTDGRPGRVTGASPGENKNGRLRSSRATRIMSWGIQEGGKGPGEQPWARGALGASQPGSLREGPSAFIPLRNMGLLLGVRWMSGGSPAGWVPELHVPIACPPPLPSHQQMPLCACRVLGKGVNVHDLCPHGAEF